MNDIKVLIFDDNDNNNVFKSLVQSIQSEYSDAKTTEIDEMIFDLYHLTSEH